MKIFWSLIILLCCTSYVHGQNYDIIKARKFANQILKDRFNDTTNLRIYLVSDLYNTLLPSESRKGELYFEIKDYMNQIEIDKQLSYCNLLSNTYKWTNDSAAFEVINGIKASEIIENSNTILIDKKKKKRKKCNKIVPYQNIIIKTSPPLFFGENQCLILLSTTRGNTIGSTCLYIYKMQANSIWIQEKVVLCSSN